MKLVNMENLLGCVWRSSKEIDLPSPSETLCSSCSAINNTRKLDNSIRLGNYATRLLLQENRFSTSTLLILSIHRYLHNTHSCKIKTNPLTINRFDGLESPKKINEQRTSYRRSIYRSWYRVPDFVD